MNILVYGNCQVNQLVNGLMFALVKKANVFGIDVNHPEAKEQLRAFSARTGEGKVDVVVTNHFEPVLNQYFHKDSIVEVPAIYFGGFHPDVIYFSLVSKPGIPCFYMNNPTVSAIALWCALNQVPQEKVASLYNEDVFEALGYMDYFDVACHAIRQSYQDHDIKLSYIDRHLSSRDVFMYGPFHPKFEVTLSLCFGICEKLGLTPSLQYDNINNMVEDPLANEYAWGCFPPLADRLGVPGSSMIRHFSHIFPVIQAYLPSFYKFIKQFQAEHGPVQFIDRDKGKFEQFHNIDTVLRRYV